jgi:hypothetical protein
VVSKGSVTRSDVPIWLENQGRVSTHPCYHKRGDSELAKLKRQFINTTTFINMPYKNVAVIGAGLFGGPVIQVISTSHDIYFNADV